MRSFLLGRSWLAVYLLFAVISPVAAHAADSRLVMLQRGVPLKIIVREPTAVYEEPDVKSKKHSAREFDAFFVLQPEKAGTGEKKYVVDGFYEVAATPTGDSAGYIKADKVVEWSHREAVGLLPISDRERMAFYKSKDDLQATYSGDVKKPLATEPPARPDRVAVLPMLEMEEIELRGEKVFAYEVAYLSGKTKEEPESKPAIDASKASLDVVFVIDATSSMQDYIDATKDVVRSVSSELRKGSMQTKIRFGLVYYRDVVPAAAGQAEVPAGVLCTLADGANPEKFLAAITDLKADGGGDLSEDVMAGLVVGLRKMDWNPNGFRQLIVIGDASAHLETDGTVGNNSPNYFDQSISGVVALAQPPGDVAKVAQTNIVMHAVRVVNASQESDATTCRDQFSKIATDGTYKGEFYELAKTDDGRREAVAKLSGAILKTRSVLEAKLKNPDATVGGSDEVLGASLLKVLGAALIPAEGETKPFGEGWVCAVDVKSQSATEPWLLVQQGELDTFNTAMEAVVRAVEGSGDPGSRDTAKIMLELQKITSALAIPDIDKDGNLLQLMGRISTLPVKLDVFDITPAKLAAMPAEEFEKFKRSVSAKVSTLDQYVNNKDIWFPLNGEKAESNAFTFIRISDLP